MSGRHTSTVIPVSTLVDIFSTKVLLMKYDLLRLVRQKVKTKNVCSVTCSKDANLLSSRKM